MKLKMYVAIQTSNNNIKIIIILNNKIICLKKKLSLNGIKLCKKKYFQKNVNSKIMTVECRRLN